VETALLNQINFQTLIATKSARICGAARGTAVLEFGLRRAQGVDGALTASRAAYIGGCAATSNVLAGMVHGIPVKGTHAHSWVMFHEDEQAAIDIWGVGTKLVTAHDQPALGGVYKLGAVQDADGTWQPRIKLSEQSIKVTNPGRVQIRRFYDGDRMLADAIWNEDLGFDDKGVLHNPEDTVRSKPIPPGSRHEDLLVPVMRNGKRTRPALPLGEIRDHAATQLEGLDKSCRRLKKPPPPSRWRGGQPLELADPPLPGGQRRGILNTTRNLEEPT
jgi:nicotinic acid phosphoribosyltransferase